MLELIQITSGYLLALIAYVLSVCGLTILNKREFARSPEKGERYKKLPLPYKLGCWFGVLPLLSGVPLLPSFILGSFHDARAAFPFGGLVAFFLLESACIRWYKKHGLLK